MLRHFTAHLEPIPVALHEPDEAAQDKQPLAKKKVSTGQVLRRRKNSAMQFS